MTGLFDKLFGNLGFAAVLPTAFVTFLLFSVGWGVLKAILTLLGLYVIVPERRAYVYVLFGKVIGVIDEPGLHFLPLKLGLAAFVVNWMGSARVVDLRLDQQYLRNSPVNSEEGAPMGIGIWYEMGVKDPVAFLFKNSDPRGSLAATVSNASVRTLSNMPLAQLLEERHRMSQMVRGEVTAHSADWGYKLGSVYIRKVQFRDEAMKRGIEHHHQHRRPAGRHRVWQSGGYSPANCGRNPAKNLARRRGGKDHVRGVGDPAAAGEQGWHHPHPQRGRAFAPAFGQQVVKSDS
jgi:hypothetical protein